MPNSEKTGKQQKKRVALKEHEITILNYVREYYLLTAWQLVNLHYSQRSLTYAQTMLQRLSGNKEEEDSPAAFLRRRGLYPMSFGNTIQLYYLGTMAINLLAELGYSITARHRRIDKFQELSYLPLIHALNTNDVLIAGRNLSKFAPDIRLDSWMHDYDLQTTPAEVSLERMTKDGIKRTEHVSLVPDGVLDFRMQRANAEKELRRVILIEIDRGTETNVEDFKRKIHAYIPYALPSGPFEQQFGRVNKRVVWIVTKGGARRRQTIQRWCEEELSKQGLEYENNLFRFTAVDQVVRTENKTGKVKISEELAIDPLTFFLTPVMYKPFETEADTLLWKSEPY